MNGKGDKNRTKDSKAYREGYARVFGKKTSFWEKLMKIHSLRKDLSGTKGL